MRGRGYLAAVIGHSRTLHTLAGFRKSYRDIAGLEEL